MRRAKPVKHEIHPDIRYNSVTIQTMIHHMLHRGKKSTAVSLMYDTLDIVRERSGVKIRSRFLIPRCGMSRLPWK